MWLLLAWYSTAVFNESCTEKFFLWQTYFHYKTYSGKVVRQAVGDGLRRNAAPQYTTFANTEQTRLHLEMVSVIKAYKIK